MRGFFFGDRGGVEKNFDLYARSEEICDLGQWNIVSNPWERGSDDTEHTASGWSGTYPSGWSWATCPIGKKTLDDTKNFAKPACNQVVLFSTYVSHRTPTVCDVPYRYMH
ncbi:hypothetical protein EV363DRAFT_1438654 [Boletus edulis]|nr:hypothetical protein EV363DRAFT_1438654 [Boletus edulis]